jgi:hypothetical protein
MLAEQLHCIGITSFQQRSTQHLTGAGYRATAVNTIRTTATTTGHVAEKRTLVNKDGDEKLDGGTKRALLSE